MQKPTGSSLAAWSIEHPIGVMMIALTLVVLGFFSLRTLGIDLLPHIIYPEIRVRISDPGVPSNIMEDKITRQLEEQLAITEDAIAIQSQTTEGRSAVDLSFAYGKNIDVALRDASTRLDRAKRFLPTTILPPTIYKKDPSQIPILTLAVSSQLRDAVELRTWVDKQLSQWLINLPGVAAAEVGGGFIREIHILPDQHRLMSLGLTVTDVINALKEDNVERASGRLYMPTQEMSTRVQGRWQSVDEIANVRVGPVFLRDIAQVIDTHQDERLRVRFNDKPGIKLSIQKQPQANTVEVVDIVQERITWLSKQHMLPADIQLDIVDNQAIYVRHALSNAAYSALSGAILAMFIVYLFLGNIRYTLIIGTAIPLSITLTLILMALGQLSLNIMTLGGLALGIGMVVDNTIVILENITRHQQNSTDSKKAAILAVGEMTHAVIASTTTNLAAIIPFFFIVGLVGLLFRELIFTISAAMIASLIVALTLVPALASHAKHTPRIQKTGHLSRLYSKLLTQLLRYPFIIIALFCIGLGFSIPTFLTGKHIFLPDLDEGKIRMNITAEPGIALQEMDNIVMEIEALLQKQPEVISVFTQMGGFIFGRSQYEATHRSSLNIQIRHDTMRTKDWILKMNKALKTLKLVGVRVRMRSTGVRGLRLGRGEEDFSLRLQGSDLRILTQLADDIVEELSTVSGLRNL
ncbi:MAG: efflux RND transporter permease subunit, partial [Thiomargarita sp.]|nr:efflux RND transporter permease subunit [Thiomargarita sp.]